MLRHGAVATDMDRSVPPQADPARLEQMFRAHQGVVWRVLRSRGLPPDVAADAAQEVFLVAAQRLDGHPRRQRAFVPDRDRPSRRPGQPLARAHAGRGPARAGRRALR
jgi:hypothetical protein